MTPTRAEQMVKEIRANGGIPFVYKLSQEEAVKLITTLQQDTIEACIQEVWRGACSCGGDDSHHLNCVALRVVDALRATVGGKETP